MFCPDCGAWNRAQAAACGRCGEALPDVPGAPTEQPDDEITLVRKATGARYRVIRRLGGGGMAGVYHAEHALLGRTVAIKVLHQHLARDGEMLERFRREAEAASQLVHPHVCPILDFGVGAGTAFIVMPFIEGGSFADRVYVRKSAEPEDVAAIGAQVACALDHAHRRGIVHRDVKPDNILLDEDDNAFLTDFGIATALFHGRLTATGRAMGTPHYMSPEQAMGKLVDGRSDLYSLGVVMYEGLVGFPPFDGADAFSVGYKQVHEQAVAPDQVDSRVPPGLSAIVMRCLAKPAGERFNRGYELADALLGWLRAAPGRETPARAATIARINDLSLHPSVT